MIFSWSLERVVVAEGELRLMHVVEPQTYVPVNSFKRPGKHHPVPTAAGRESSAEAPPAPAAVGSVQVGT